MTIEALAGDVVALLDHLGIAEADLFGFSLGGLVAYAVALGAPSRVGKLIVASADAHRPPGRESAPLDDDRMPTPADFQAMRDAYDAVAPDPAHFDEFAAKTSTMVHEFPGWTDELRSLQRADPADLRRPRLLTVARRGRDVRTPAERATRRAPRDHARRRDRAARRSARADHAVPRRFLRRRPPALHTAASSQTGQLSSSLRWTTRLVFLRFASPAVPAPVAQGIEHRFPKPCVAGSNPAGGALCNVQRTTA